MAASTLPAPIRCLSCGSTVHDDCSFPSDQRKPRTYASLPVETRRRVVVGLELMMARNDALQRQGPPYSPKLVRLWNAMYRLESYIVGDQA